MTPEGGKLAFITDMRQALHRALLDGPLRISDGIPAVADTSSKSSIEFAHGMVSRMGVAAQGKRLVAQMSGMEFEVLVTEFIRSSFSALRHLRPGNWSVSRGGSIEHYEQYRHLHQLSEAIEGNPELAAIVGRGYLIKPDILVFRSREPDSAINAERYLVDSGSAHLTSLRNANDATPLLHACVSCKWTLRSDRAQNARSEGLTLIRNRKGRLPHVVVVTAEPSPGRLASLALGTGDIDHVYHIALPELEAAVAATDHDDAGELLGTMVSGNRLRDIADLPLDLAV